MSVNRIDALKQWLANTLNIKPPLLEPICGDASFRQYYRLTINDKTLIAVDSPAQNQKNHEFVEYAQLLLNAQLLAPEVIAVDYQQGFMCLSDLGDELLFSQLNAQSMSAWYGKALSLLPQLQTIDTKSASLPVYDADFIEQENQIFSQWLVKEHLALSLSEDQQALLQSTYSLLIENNLAQPQVAMHRDFHSRNLMLLNENIAIIDFQDMVLGPITYDAVSLLRDCYCRWPDTDIERLKREYFELCQLENVNWAEFSTWFDLTGLQRHIKAAGIFARLYHRDGKSAYLKDIPRTLDYIIDIAGQYPNLQTFSEFARGIKVKFMNQATSQHEVVI